MKLFNEYLSSKIKKDFIAKEFPEIKTDKNIQDWLKENKFKYIDTKKDIYFTDVIIALSNEKTENSYTLGDFDSNNEYSFWIAFKAKGNLSKDNPVFFLRLTRDSYMTIHCYSQNHELDSKDIEKFEDYESFRDKVNNIRYKI